MSVSHRSLFLIPAVAFLLSGCGGTPSSKPQLLGPVNSPTAQSAALAGTPAPTQAPVSTSTPTAAVTLPPAAPMPGLVYLGAGSIGLSIVHADGQSEQLSTETNPRLSPDQKQVIYSKNGDIWLTDLATKKIFYVARTNDKIEADYQWWPARPGIIVFHYQRKTDIQPVAGFLATVKTNGENYLVIEGEVGSNSPAALSPDGQSIAFDRGGIPWIYNYTGGIMPILPRSFQEKYRIAVNPAWSPDSRKIAWQMFGDQAGTDGWSAVAIMDFDSLQVTLIHRYMILGGGDIGNYHLAWSPDGKWLAAADQAELAPDGKVSLWVMSPDGSEEHHIGGGDRPIWSPDGSTLVYESGNNVYAVKTSDWNPFPVTLPANSLVIDWVKV